MFFLSVLPCVLTPVEAEESDYSWVQRGRPHCYFHVLRKCRLVLLTSAICIHLGERMPDRFIHPCLLSQYPHSPISGVGCGSCFFFIHLLVRLSPSATSTNGPSYGHRWTTWSAEGARPSPRWAWPFRRSKEAPLFGTIWNAAENPMWPHCTEPVLSFSVTNGVRSWVLQYFSTEVSSFFGPRFIQWEVGRLRPHWDLICFPVKFF